jgi:hypothetical protein
VGSVISAYLTLTHTSREGANLTSRGTQPNPALDAIIAASSNTFSTANQIGPLSRSADHPLYL